MNKGYKRFIEDNLDIVNKEGTRVPFILNSVQDSFLLEDFVQSKAILLKARQQGFSSLILAMFLADFLLKENTYNMVVADSRDNALGLLKRVKDYLTSWGTHNKVNTSKMLKYNSKYELYFEPNNSTYHIGTAQNTNLGRSKTITNLHLSEGAFYPHFDDMIAGAMQAVVPGGRVIIETTANGFNPFKTYWDKTVAGETPFIPCFYKGSDFYSKEFLDQKRSELQRMFKQEYPETPTEAFITSGDTYFDNLAMEQYLELVRKPITTDLVYAGF